MAPTKEQVKQANQLMNELGLEKIYMNSKGEFFTQKGLALNSVHGQKDHVVTIDAKLEIAPEQNTGSENPGTDNTGTTNTSTAGTGTKSTAAKTTAAKSGANKSTGAAKGGTKKSNKKVETPELRGENPTADNTATGDQTNQGQE